MQWTHQSSHLTPHGGGQEEVGGATRQGWLAGLLQESEHDVLPAFQVSHAWSPTANAVIPSIYMVPSHDDVTLYLQYLY